MKSSRDRKNSPYSVDNNGNNILMMNAINENNNTLAQKSSYSMKKYNISKVILLKGITLSMNKDIILTKCRQFGKIQDYLFIWGR